MSIVLRGFVGVLCVALLVCVVHLVGHDKLQLKYSLLWLVLVAALLVSALFPDCLFSLSKVLGFETASNFTFFAGLFCLLAICLSLSVIVSRQTLKIKNLVQRLALVEYELNQLIHEDGCSKGLRRQSLQEKRECDLSDGAEHV